MTRGDLVRPCAIGAIFALSLFRNFCVAFEEISKSGEWRGGNESVSSTHLNGNDTTLLNGASASPDIESYPGMELAIGLISKWFRVISISLGIPGNFLAFLVTTRKDNRRISACAYMAALSVVDSVVLLGRIVYGSLMALEPSMKGNETYLRWHYYAYRSAAIISSLFLAEMTLDRAVNIVYPMKAGRLCSASKAWKIIIITLAVQLAIHINVFFTYSISYPPTGLLKRSVPGARWVEALFDSYQLIVGAVLPFLLIAGGNAVIIFAVRRASRNRKQMTSEVKGQTQEASLTRMLILVSSAYIVCNVPFRLYETLLSIPGIAPMYHLGSRYWDTRRNLESWVVSELWNLNFAINFYLYFLGGGKKFRRDVSELFRCGSNDKHVTSGKSSSG